MLNRKYIPCLSAAKKFSPKIPDQRSVFTLYNLASVYVNDTYTSDSKAVENGIIETDRKLNCIK